MSLIKLKVCGMMDKDNILDVASLRPDYLGFIFYKPSPRYVGADFEIPIDLDPTIKKVGVFVNEQIETVMAVAAKHQLHLVQLHGEETPEECLQLREKGIDVIKVFSIAEKFNFSSLKPYESLVDYFLFDTKGKLRGGIGIPFDWSILKDYKSKVPFFLSGGINPDNANQISNVMHPNLYSIDVNSGVEDTPGIKNKQKLKDLISKIFKPKA